MGLGVSGHTILGIQVSRDDFWLPYGEEATCSFCGKKAAHPSERFCSADGREMRVRALEKPTENFAKYAASINEEPTALWKRMQEAKFCSIWRCNAMQSCDDEVDRKFALGFRLGRTSSHRSRGDDGVTATDFESCKLLVEQIKEMKVKLGIPGDPLVRIFTCVYLSY
jgi:hypothetical protein